MKKNNPTMLNLNKRFFGPVKQTILQSRAWSIEGFAYQSGVEAVTIEVGRGVFTWTPFMGSELWDWSVDGVSRKFEGFRKEPIYQAPFLANYGAFLIHCGVRGMGGPSKEDTHPHHGELPVSQPARAWIEIDEEDKEFPLALCAEFHSHIPFVGEYSFVPALRIHKSGTFVVVESGLTNLAHAPFEYQYLGHVNFNYPKSGRLEYSIANFTDREVVVLDETFEGVTKKPELFLTLDKGCTLDPELVAVIDYGKKSPSTFRNGKFALSRMSDEKGGSTWVVARTDILDHTVIWLTQTPDRKAAGFALPATSGPTGFTNEKKMGNGKVLPGKQSITLWYAFGVGDGDIEKDIATALSRSGMTE